MRVRALTLFVDESGRHEPGDEFEMEDSLAASRQKHGLVAFVVQPRTATKQPEATVMERPETTTSPAPKGRKGRR